MLTFVVMTPVLPCPAADQQEEDVQARHGWRQQLLEAHTSGSVPSAEPEEPQS